MSAFHQTYRIEARSVFDSLVKNQETTYAAYAHHLSRACWHGSRIVLRQTSPEAEGIFDFIIELHRACNGRWDDFLNLGIGQEELNTWLDFAGMFLSSLGNYFVSIWCSLQLLVTVQVANTETGRWRPQGNSRYLRRYLTQARQYIPWSK